MGPDFDEKFPKPAAGRDWKLSPLSIGVLFHCHCNSDQMPRRDAPAVQDALEHFKLVGLIECGERFDHGFQTTRLGRALVEMLCKTPLPVLTEGFQDPRTGEWVG
jgi:hypothetical protein